MTGTAVPAPGRALFGLGIPNAELNVASGTITAGLLSIRAAAPLRVINPPNGPAYFNSPRTIGLTLEQVSFALAADPRGYGDPDSGWHRVAATNLVLAAPIPDAPADRAVFAVSYGPSSDPATYNVTAEAAPNNAVQIHTPNFSAVIGHPSGDEQGEPTLTLTPALSPTPIAAPTPTTS